MVSSALFLNAFFFHFSLMMIGSEHTRVAASKMNSKASNSVVAGPNLAAGSLCRSVPRVWSCKGEVCNDQCNQVQLQMIWVGSDEALASNSSVRALLQNSAWHLHDAWFMIQQAAWQDPARASGAVQVVSFHVPLTIGRSARCRGVRFKY